MYIQAMEDSDVIILPDRIVFQTVWLYLNTYFIFKKSR
jgi:hypothetical protein